MTRFLWSQREDIGPSPRYVAAVCYDSDRRQVLLYGGEGTGSIACHDTWAWDGNTWVQLADTGPPLASGGRCMAYFASRQRAVLVAGSDTWEWDGTLWTQVADTGPLPYPNLCYDATRKRVLNLRGDFAPPAQNAQTSEWDGAQWTQVADTGPLRTGAPLAYDSDRKVAVLYGGMDYSGTYADTWTWDGSTWRKVQDMGPSRRASASMVFDSDRSRVVLFGGDAWDSFSSPQEPVFLEMQGPLGDTWEWDGHLWHQLQDIGPSARAWSAMAYDSGRKRTALFGGMATSGIPSGPHHQVFGDTWELGPYD